MDKDKREEFLQECNDRIIDSNDVVASMAQELVRMYELPDVSTLRLIQANIAGDMLFGTMEEENVEFNENTSRALLLLMIRMLNLSTNSLFELGADPDKGGALHLALMSLSLCVAQEMVERGWVEHPGKTS